MLAVAFRRILALLNKGDGRSVKVKKNILAAFFFKGANILVGFVLVPLTLNYLDKTTYGVWLVMASVLTYFALFDIGLGNGMRNRLAESMAKEDHEKGRIYVSTTYASMAMIMGALSLIFLALYPFLPWEKIFNVPTSLEAEIGQVVLVVFLLFFFKFFLQLISKILMADQRSAFTNFFNFTGNFILLIVIFILSRTTEGSLFLVALVFSLSPIIILTVASLYFFSNDFKQYRPSFKHVNFTYFGDLIGLGGKFFIIQVAAVVLYATDLMLINQFFEPEAVTPYFAAQKYFNMIPIFFGMITTPLWSAITEANTKGDIPWIKRTVNTAMKLWLGVAAALVVMLLLSSWFYPLWLRRDDIIVPFSLSAAMAVYAGLFSFNSIFSVYINGVGKLRLQTYTAIFSIIANVPLSYLFGVVWELGPTGVIMATTVSVLVNLAQRPYQYYVLVNGKAKGLWNK